jgi:glycosyltransferase involved in cell wall biosynthesis
MKKVTVAIDASRNRSGGTISHLVGILSSVDPRECGVELVHLWSYEVLLNKIPNYPWLVKHSPAAINKTLIFQIWWQCFIFPTELKRIGCDVLLSTDAGTLCHHYPDIVMSRDMLSFEAGEMNRYPIFSKSKIRLLILKWLQIRSLRKATGVLFLTKYASDVIQLYSGKLKKYKIIPHGIGDNFRRNFFSSNWPDNNGSIKCTYVSNSDLYKHQWNVVDAIGLLRNAGFDVSLNLIGAGSGFAVGKVIDTVKRVDPEGAFVKILTYQEHGEIAGHLFESDIFIFASSCENMPNTLIEAMAAGLPIACSDRGPMPEVLQNGGVYFNPEDHNSIFAAVKIIIEDKELRANISKIALARSRLFSWNRCSRETWQYIVEINAYKTSGV